MQLLETDNESKFIENLNYQISKKNQFYEKMPVFHQKLDNLNFKLNLKESISKLRRKFEKIRYRDLYKSTIKEFSELIYRE